ncbi:hypothetical protein [Streptomyces sp. NPDC050535]|uniref:hypothetical protein n=1 Tax=Streptomyces sp. NPDC050535 TaxID=3365626 RepID=UPI0037B72279
MSAPTHTRHHPATKGRIEIHLPWWALALPTLAFVTLLLLILNPADAHAAGTPAITDVFEQVQRTVLHQTP